jgi:hypothetical protein
LRFFRLLAVVLCALWAYRLCASPENDRQGPKSNLSPIIVTLRNPKGHLSYEIDPDPAPGIDVLRGLQLLCKQRGGDYPVIGLIEDNVHVADMGAVSGVAGKAQFSEIHTFLVNRETQMMTEIGPGTTQVLSRNPVLSSPEEHPPILMVVEKVHGHVAYKVQPSPAARTDILRSLQILSDRRGANYPVTVLVDENVPLLDLLNALHLTEKARLKNVHTFVLDYDLKRMWEIHFCAAQPFSRTPALNHECSSAN